ncbi:MAG: hypothetical protein HXY47_08220 [Nitrospirae bacterium]|nr:hypothetical protein [Nitrospirota bacterium]
MEILNLKIKKLKEGELFFTSPHVDFKGRIKMPFKGVVEKVKLTQPVLKFRFEKKNKLNLSFIKKLPPIHLLSINKGEFLLSFANSTQIIKISDIDLEVKDFSPEKGGRIGFNGNFKILSNNKAGITGEGNVKAQFKFSKFFPVPAGDGSLELYIKSGLYKSSSFKNLVLRFPVSVDKEKMVIDSISLNLDTISYRCDDTERVLRNLNLHSSFFYDFKTGTMSSYITEGKLSNLGGFKGSVQGTLRDNFPWSASLEASEVNFETVYSIFKPLFPPSYQKWFVEGRGLIEVHIKGDYTKKKPSWAGDMALYLKQGGFGSPDGTKAGQGIEGRVILKIRSPISEEKVNFELYSEVGEGEFLWRKFYKDFSGEKIKFNSLGSFFLKSPTILEFQGSFDLFGTGEYTYSGLIQKDETLFALKAQRISNNKILSIFKDYLSLNFPSFSNIQFDGNSQLDIRVIRKDGIISTEGVFEIKNTSLNIPNKSLSINQLNLVLPFDLLYPHSFGLIYNNSKNKTGYLKIGMFEEGRLRLEGLSIPIILSKNNLSIPEEVQISLFGGKVNIANFNGKEILSSSREFDFGLRIQGIDMNSLSQWLNGVNISGLVDADFPEVRCHENFLDFQGKAIAKIFGGEVEITNLSIKDVFSQSRNISGDVVFRNIDLEKVTENIKIGKMTGIVEGSIRNMEIEYGQLSRFILDIDSVERRGVQQKISVDAVENISILGTGSEDIGGILKSGIRSFFKEYPYSKIGIRCTLENDKFSVRGKIYSGGREYLVRRSFLRGIDVVNQNPDNIISFKDMQERIKRIFRAKEGKK